MFRFTLFCLVISLVHCGQEKEKVKIAPEKALVLANEMMKCANEVNGEMVDLMDQMFSWNIRDEDKLKRFLFCFSEKQGFADKHGKFVIQKILDLTGDFRTKDKFVKVVENCNAKAIGNDKVDKLFSAADCMYKNTPVMFTI